MLLLGQLLLGHMDTGELSVVELPCGLFLQCVSIGSTTRLDPRGGVWGGRK